MTKAGMNCSPTSNPDGQRQAQHSQQEHAQGFEGEVGQIAEPIHWTAIQCYVATAGSTELAGGGLHICAIETCRLASTTSHARGLD